MEERTEQSVELDTKQYGEQVKLKTKPGMQFDVQTSISKILE